MGRIIGGAKHFRGNTSTVSGQRCSLKLSLIVLVLKYRSSSKKSFLKLETSELQYCNNDVATPGTPYFTFINPVVCNKLGSDSAICTRTSSYYMLSLDQLAQIH